MPGVLILRLEEARSVDKVAVVQEILERHEQKPLGRFAVYRDVIFDAAASALRSDRQVDWADEFIGQL